MASKFPRRISAKVPGMCIALLALVTISDRANAESAHADADMRGRLSTLDQANTKNELDVTATIRKELVDSNLSTYAKNIKIITTKDARVQLQGEVESGNESAKIEEIAKRIAGDRMIDNRLEIKK